MIRAIQARVREAEVEEYLDLCVRRAGGITRKFVSPGRTGVPDRIVLFCGRVEFVEVKAPGGRLSAVQVREIARLRAHGTDVYVVSSREEVEAYVGRLTGFEP